MMESAHNGSGGESLDFDYLAGRYYGVLYRFALALTHSEADASDLTQQTFFVWATKGGQLRNVSKAKSWLFTTLHRVFLQSRRRQGRFPHFELNEVEAELPCVTPAPTILLDSARVHQALEQLDQGCRAAVTLFYLEDYPYKEIARILDVPLGTVKSRISRGIAQLHQLLVLDDPGVPRPPSIDSQGHESQGQAY